MRDRIVTIMDEADTNAIMEYLDELRELMMKLIERKSVVLPDHDEDSIESGSEDLATIF